MRKNQSKTKFKIILILFIFIILLSGCQKGKSALNSDWENEVLYASECGMDGLRCCEEDPRCRYGQSCCVHPEYPELNYCADDCSLGQDNSWCRTEDPRCDQGLACFNERCVICGRENDPCCREGDICGPDLLCHKDKCVRCGLPGNPCCEGSACEADGIEGPGHTECRDGVCIYCGYSGKIACQNEPGCFPGHLENNEKCFLCGVANKPCCDIDHSGYRCLEQSGLVCDLGFCSPAK